MSVHPLHQPRILIVDDDRLMLEIQSEMLRNVGYQAVATAEGSGNALDLLLGKLSAFDVIVCDLNMPGIDGIAFLKAISEAGFRGNVVLLSGEGPRILHSVQKILRSTGLCILGALEKPASLAAMRLLLDQWKPFQPESSESVAISISAEDLHRATRDGQWELHYQPQVSLASGDLVGVEALIRWNHPIHGLLMPDRFIGLAEEFGAIDEMTDWVASSALRQLSSWKGDGLRMNMSINVSADTLQNQNFAFKLYAAVRDFGASPRDVTLEVTESRIVSTAPALECLVRLCLRRFGLSIDDFGTGHSSLAQLRDIPFSELKIDRSFVTGAKNSQIIRPMLEASLGIATRLGMQSVAEGVETEEDWQLLRELGCKIAQGYLIARPMPAEKLPEWRDLWTTRRKHLVDE